MRHFIHNQDSITEALGNAPIFRVKQCIHAVYQEFIDTWEDASTLPKELRERLSDTLPLTIDAKFFEANDASTVKALVLLADGERIETVLMRHDEGRNTVCVSSQVGCGMHCAFCATGELGLKRNLEADEIIDQVMLFERYLAKQNERVTNVVFMGMGEPMLNFDNVIKAVETFNSPDAFNISSRKISISTCGIIDGIRKLTKLPLQVNLAISLHAPDNGLRGTFMPINASYPIDELMGVLKDYIDQTGRKVMIEYILLHGVNDHEEHARKLAVLLNRNLKKLFMVNVIPYNETGKFIAPERDDVMHFRHALEREGVEVTERHRFGHDIAGACGQLAAREK
jgi:23S rRNA (adenine2503-C2)-methyltransferase